jgi:hypothetical protein
MVRPASVVLGRQSDGSGLAPGCGGLATLEHPRLGSGQPNDRPAGWPGGRLAPSLRRPRRAPPTRDAGGAGARYDDPSIGWFMAFLQEEPLFLMQPSVNIKEWSSSEKRLRTRRRHRRSGPNTTDMRDTIGSIHAQRAILSMVFSTCATQPTPSTGHGAAIPSHAFASASRQVEGAPGDHPGRSLHARIHQRDARVGCALPAAAHDGHAQYGGLSLRQFMALSS